MPSRELLTTCPSPQHSMESQTCRSIYISLSPVPPDPRLLLTSFPNLPKNLAPCWSTPSSDSTVVNFFSKPSEKPGSVL